jgi:hypothetical protein
VGEFAAATQEYVVTGHGADGRAFDRKRSGEQMLGRLNGRDRAPLFSGVLGQAISSADESRRLSSAPEVDAEADEKHVVRKCKMKN